MFADISRAISSGNYKGSVRLPAFNCCCVRRVVERTLAWLDRNRRLAKDFEASIARAKAWVYIALAQLLIRRLS
jgi:transposase